MNTADPKVETWPHGLLAVLAVASIASASFSVWVVAHVIDDRWALIRPELYSAMLQFLARGLMA